MENLKISRQEIQEFYEDQIERYIDDENLAGQLTSKTWEIFGLCYDIEKEIEDARKAKEAKKYPSDADLANEFNYTCTL